MAEKKKLKRCQRLVFKIKVGQAERRGTWECIQEVRYRQLGTDWDQWITYYVPSKWSQDLCEK